MTKPQKRESYEYCRDPKRTLGGRYLKQTCKNWKPRYHWDTLRKNIVAALRDNPRQDIATIISNPSNHNKPKEPTHEHVTDTSRHIGDSGGN